MKAVSIVLALLALATGLQAAWLWFKSSKVEINPAWELDIRGDINKNIMGWVTGLMQTFTRSSKLNAKAAIWTAASVFLSAVSAVAGAFSN